VKVALLTGGKDPHYARGLLQELATQGVRVAVVGGDELADADAVVNGRVEFHNLVGAAERAGGLCAAAWRVVSYYGRLLAFVARTDADVLHILWFRKFPALERVLLTTCCKLLGETLAFTAHNVDDQTRDGRRGTLLNRLSLRFLYTAVDHIFVHTDPMKRELADAFGVPDAKITVVPFGLNKVIPVSSATRSAARRAFGFAPDERVLLFFGNIAPYKGVDDLLRALAILVREGGPFTLILAGRVKDAACAAYWAELERLIAHLGLGARVRKEIRYIPDGDVGLFFRASDVSVLPYRRVYQSGVVALSYAQGLPVIASDIDSLRADVVAGETGLLFRAGDVQHLAATIRAYYASEAFQDSDSCSRRLREYAARRFSWAANVELACAAYERLASATAAARLHCA